MSAYLKLRGEGPSFLLESAEQGQRFGRWSFLGCPPRTVIRVDAGVLTIGGEQREFDDPYAAVAEELERYRVAPLDGPAAVRRRRRGPVRLRPRARAEPTRGRAQPGRRSACPTWR